MHKIDEERLFRQGSHGSRRDGKPALNKGGKAECSGNESDAGDEQMRRGGPEIRLTVDMERYPFEPDSTHEQQQSEGNCLA